MKKDIYILGIETSCDETAASIVKNGTEIISNVVASQIVSQKRFGGVVPEIASRHHVEQITIVIEEALTNAGLKPADLDAVAVTEGPGLSRCIVNWYQCSEGICICKWIADYWCSSYCGSYLCE